MTASPQFRRRLERPPADPMTLFARWFADARKNEPSDPNAMTLASATPAGQPSARIVLLKDWNTSGEFRFYTNAQSRKGRELQKNTGAALLFHWKSLRRQIRVEGRAKLLSPQDADAYFATRPRGAQTGAWASAQSRPLAGGLETLRRRVAETEARFAGGEVPRPPHWRGYSLRARRIEFWNEGAHRLHERVEYRRSAGGWRWTRLYP